MAENREKMIPMVHFIFVIQDYLEVRGMRYNTSLSNEILLRKNGKKYIINDHIRGMIYSMLSNQTRWHLIEPHLPEIDTLFFNYDPETIVDYSAEYFTQKIFELKCGNMSTRAQMEALKENITVFQTIEDEFGSIDAFVTSESPDKIVNKLSRYDSPYKLKMIGPALAWEYLRNIGIDGVKPDTHLRRFFGSDRMGKGGRTPASIRTVNKEVEAISEETGLTKIEIDNLIWSFCADGYGEICTARPQCRDCPISDYCNNKL